MEKTAHNSALTAEWKRPNMFAGDRYSRIVPAPEHTMPCNVEGGGRIRVDPSRLIADFMLHRCGDK